MVTDQLIWLFIGLIVGYTLRSVTAFYTNRQLVQLAEMKLMVGAGRDPMLAKIQPQPADAAPTAPKKMDSVDKLNKKIQEQYGDEYEVL
jgi:hypothetical protein